jgi:ubiquinone/menaquinone biosynthesis C-methylase UbiE
MTEHHHHHGFLPAAGHDLLLPLYDAVTRLTGLDKKRRLLVERAELAAGQRVLDVGCGTGSLVIAVKRRHPAVEVVGIDPDPKVLRIAERKVARAKVDVGLDRGFAGSLPYPDASFDRVLSSFMFHHLSAADKSQMLREALRVLRPGGRLELVDFGRPEGRSWLPFHKHLGGNAERDVVALLEAAGFRDTTASRRTALLFGPIVYYRAAR